MDTNPVRCFSKFELPAIFLIGAFLIGAAATHDPGQWRIATVGLFSASAVAAFLAFYLATKFQHRWT
jgi:hypothetical protein